MPQGATSALAWVGFVGLVVLVFAAGSQGRARHLMLMLLGAAPRRNAREVLTDVVVPRGERDWSLVQQVAAEVTVVQVEPAATPEAPAPRPLLTSGPAADEAEDAQAEGEPQTAHRARGVRAGAAA